MTEQTKEASRFLQWSKAKEDWFQSRSPSACDSLFQSLIESAQLPPPRASGSNSFFFLSLSLTAYFSLLKTSLTRCMNEWGRRKWKHLGRTIGLRAAPSLSPRKRVLVNRARDHTGGHIFSLSLSLSPHHLFHDIPVEEIASKQRRLLESSTEGKEKGPKGGKTLSSHLIRPNICPTSPHTRSTTINGNIPFSYLLLSLRPRRLFVFISTDVYLSFHKYCVDTTQHLLTFSLRQKAKKNFFFYRHNNNIRPGKSYGCGCHYIIA